MPGEPWVGLTDAVRELRKEIGAAMTAAEGEDLRFELGPIEIEFALTLTRTGGADAGVNFGVVAVGARGERGSETVHRLTLTLEPKTSTGRSAQISGRMSSIPHR
jgi:hypothetical protein